MKKLLALLLAGVAVSLFAAAGPKFEPLPAPVCNNAVAFLKTRGQSLIFSFMGIGPKKTWDAITNAAYAMDVETGKWSQMRPVPGTAGRIGASAIGGRDHVFLFGGYVVDAQGGETTVPDLNVYQPLTDRWFRGADIPVPIDDSVAAGLYKDRYIYLVSGWSKNDTVNNVQIYDAQKNKWAQGTPIPGRTVFGHAGALVGDTIIYVDGAYKNPSGTPKFIASDECWMGKIDHHDPTKIQWTKLPNHPGTARYRMAAGASDKDDRIYFAGGTDNPYNFIGIGYDGKPSEPSPTAFALNLKTSKWEVIDERILSPTMDHRGLIVMSQGLVVIGGMDAGQKVTAKVTVLSKHGKAQ
jgi:N-acetylneuraminic acid mutarotase